jgi:hypothetical protein
MVTRFLIALLLGCVPDLGAQDGDPWATFRGNDGPGLDRHIVFVTGDDEYRSEETMPMLAEILAKRLGFTCTVLFAINRQTGVIDTDQRDNIPGLEQLENADLLVLFTRFRELPDEQMRHLVDYLDRGKPVVGLRTATHAFKYTRGSTSAFAKYTFRNPDPAFLGGFGRQVLGQDWVNHWGAHGKQSTRGVFAPGAAGHPLLRGIADGEIWGPTDVYEASLPLPDGCQPLLLGQVLQGMTPGSPPVDQPELNPKWKRMVEKNAPMMPVAWTWQRPVGYRGRVFTCTMGGDMAGGSDLANAGLRRLLVNACCWALHLEDRVPHVLDVTPVRQPNPWKRGVRPQDIPR